MKESQSNTKSTMQVSIVERLHHANQIMTIGLVVFLLFTMLSCSSRETPETKLTVPIAGVWLAPLLNEGIFYIIDYDPKTSHGTLSVEYRGKTEREYTFTVSSASEIQLSGATRGKAYVFEENKVDMAKLSEALRLTDPPRTLRFEVKPAVSQEDNSLMIYGLIQFGSGTNETPIPVSWMSKTSRTILPFKNVKAAINLNHDSAKGYFLPDVIQSKSIFGKLTHVSGQVTKLTINGKLVPLVDPNLKDGMLRTKDFGDLEFVVDASTQKKSAFLVTRSQIINISKWLEKKSGTKN